MIATHPWLYIHVHTPTHNLSTQSLILSIVMLEHVNQMHIRT